MRWGARREEVWTYRDEADFYRAIAEEAATIARVGAVSTPYGPFSVTDKARLRAVKVAEKMRKAADLVLQAGRYEAAIKAYRETAEPKELSS